MRQTTAAALSLSYPLLEAKKSPPPRRVPAILERIAQCESENRQFDETGSVLRGVNSRDIGKYQINEQYWGKEAKQLGYDLLTEEGNEAMALELYRRYRTTPWKWSRACWQNANLADLAPPQP